MAGKYRRHSIAHSLASSPEGNARDVTTPSSGNMARGHVALVLLGLAVLEFFAALFGILDLFPSALADDNVTSSTLWTRGHNNRGQLGDGTTTDRTTGTQELTAETDWAAISAGGYYTVALKSDGTLWAWGDNRYGQLGNGTTVDRTTPTQESTGATNWSAIATGGYHTVALKSDGTLWAWGYNGYGSLGDGTIVSKSAPTQEATGATDWSVIAAGGFHTIAIKADGSLWAWGNNEIGQVGDGTTVNKDAPTQESTGGTNWSAISAGDYHTVALKSDGALWAWGHNQYGQLGDGTLTHRHTPVRESTGASNWSAIATGKDHTIALKSDGTLWAWGYNSFSQVGDGNTVDISTPT